jgi:hypothetical protein
VISQHELFIADMRESGFTCEDYHGRHFYHGPCVSVKGRDALQEVIRATRVPLQWDTLGKSGYVIYPARE